MPAAICKISLVFSLAFLPVFTHAQAALININTATLAELDTLPGVGPAIAQRIIDARPYDAVTEISRVQGIGGPGSSTYENIIGLITVGGSTGGTASSTPTASAGVNSASSVHYGSNPISNMKYKDEFSLNAGRDRIGSMGSPLEFMAETDFEYTRSTIFGWNFGDGSIGSGDVVSHTYEYPGEYVVVLSASLPTGGQIVSRVNVKIVDPELSIITANPERIEVRNSSKQEANLFGRALVVGDRSFVFPPDTIIKSGQSISFSSKITGLFPTAIVAVNIFALGTTEQPKFSTRIEEEKIKQIAKIEKDLGNLEAQLAASHTYSGPTAVAKNLEAKLPIEEQESEESTEIKVAESQTAVAAKSSWFDLIKRFFLRTR